MIANTFETPDDVDRKILAALTSNPRMRITDLGREIGLSAPATGDRVRRLEEAGVLSYRAIVNPEAIGFPISAIIRVSPQSTKVRMIPEIAEAIPEITECYRITGEDCYFMRVYLRSIRELEDILDQFTPHGRTTTSIVHSAAIPARALPLD